MAVLSLFGGAADQGLPGKGLAAARAGAGLVGVVFDDAFDETLEQRAFAAFPVFEQPVLLCRHKIRTARTGPFLLGLAMVTRAPFYILHRNGDESIQVCEGRFIEVQPGYSLETLFM